MTVENKQKTRSLFRELGLYNFSVVHMQTAWRRHTQLFGISSSLSFPPSLWLLWHTVLYQIYFVPILAYLVYYFLVRNTVSLHRDIEKSWTLILLDNYSLHILAFLLLSFPPSLSLWQIWQTVHSSFDLSPYYSVNILRACFQLPLNRFFHQNVL